MKTAKLAAPFKHRLSGPDALGFYLWKHIHEEGAMVYERSFCNIQQVESFLDDRYGKRFANSVLKEAAYFSAK